MTEPTRIGLGQFEAADRHLRRSMSLTQLLFLGVSAQIGSGWLFAVLAAAGIAGPAAAVSWIVACILIGLIALAFAEISGMLPRSGAIVRYPYLTHGAFSGWIIGWAYWLSAVSIPPIEAEAVLTYVGGRFPQAGLLSTQKGVTVLSWPVGIGAGVGLMLVFFCLNYFGARFLSESNRWVTIWKLLIPTLTFCFLFAVFDSGNYTSFGGIAPFGAAPVFHAISTSGIIFSLIGFRQALDYGGEVRNPQRNIPIATWGSIAIPLVIYTALQLAFVGSIDWGDMGLNPGSWGDLVTSSWASGPFFKALDATGVAAFAAFGTVLLIDAGISPGATGWVYLGTSTRTAYGLSIHGNAPRPFQLMNRFGIPWLALLGSAVIGCLFYIPAPSWYQLVGFISAAAVLTFITGGVGLPVLRRTAPELARPFRLGWAAFWAPIGYLAAVLILYWWGFAILANVFAATFVGLPLFAWYLAWKRGWVSPAAGGVLGAVFLGAWIYVNDRGGWVLTASGSQRPGSWPFPVYDIAFSAAVVFFCAALWVLSKAEGRRHIERTGWLIWLILATFPLSYYGFYGPLDHAPIGFPWGTLIEIGIGLVGYAWGVRSGFATDEIRSIVEGSKAIS
ncbi:MAG: APC family permease [Streptosporangiaceae bacterium]